jgi:Flp pilus assembly protein TadD
MAFVDARIPIGNWQSAIGNGLIDWTPSARDGKTMILMFAKRPDRAAQVSQALKLAAQSVAQGKPDEAVRICRNLLAKFPNDARIHYALGVALGHIGQIDPAIDRLRQAIRLKPDLFEAHTNLGVLLGRRGNPDESMAAFIEAIRLRPDVAELQMNLSNALRENWRFEQAIAAAQKAIALKPSLPEAQLCLGAAMACVGRFDRAIDAYRCAIRLRPDFPAAHLNLALAELVTGNFERGWPEYEWRRQCPSALPPRKFAQAPWKGHPLDGKTILLHAEQGFGDAIHFIRYAPLVAGRGGKIVLECQPALVRLFGNFPGVGQIVTTGQPLPAFDYQCPLPSLPGVFGTTMATIPATIPYLAADAEAADAWRKRMEPAGEFLRVGLAWAGSPDNRNDRNRSIPLEKFAPLSAVDGVRFHSLQTAPPPAAGGIVLSDWSAMLTDFAETAALIENLDLVISVDTGVAHLAGAMGKPVWLLVPFPPDWRWLLDRADSPWYPTIRLFRQETPGDWDGVIRRVAAELSRHKSNRG